MARNDGRPKSVGVLRVDPFPYRNKYDGSRWRDPGVDSEGLTVVFDPRPGFIQDEESYGG